MKAGCISNGGFLYWRFNCVLPYGISSLRGYTSGVEGLSDSQEHCFFIRKTECAHYLVLYNMICVLVYDQSILAIPSGHF